jgi:hypothetical protein
MTEKRNPHCQTHEPGKGERNWILESQGRTVEESSTKTVCFSRM